MAFRQGRFGEITINSVNLTSFAHSAALDADVDELETTTFGNSWRSYLAGLIGAEVPVSFYWDPTTTTGPASALTALLGAAPFTFIYEPGGASVTQARSGSAIITKYSEKGEVDGICEIEATFRVTGAVTFES